MIQGPFASAAALRRQSWDVQEDSWTEARLSPPVWGHFPCSGLCLRSYMVPASSITAPKLHTLSLGN